MSNLRTDYTSESPPTTGATTGADRPTIQRDHDRGTESKSGFKTTELFVYILAVIGVLVASYIAGGDSSGAAADGDYFDADQAWIMLLPALIFGFAPLMFAILPLLGLFQIMLWMRLARRPEAR